MLRPIIWGLYAHSRSFCGSPWAYFAITWINWHWLIPEIIKLWFSGRNSDKRLMTMHQKYGSGVPKIGWKKLEGAEVSMQLRGPVIKFYFVKSRLNIFTISSVAVTCVAVTLQLEIFVTMSKLLLLLSWSPPYKSPHCNLPQMCPKLQNVFWRQPRRSCMPTLPIKIGSCSNFSG
jgi:hypothetical protein